MTFKPQIIFGRKASLRPFRAADVGRIEQVASKECVARNTSLIPHPYPQGAANAFLDHSISSLQAIWALDATAWSHGEYIGSISLSQKNGEIELGYILDPAFWNLGYMSAAVVDLMEANPLHAQKVYSGVFQDNPASARVLTKAGFSYLGEDEVFSVARNAIVPRWRYVYRYDH